MSTSEIEPHITKKYEIKKRLGKGVSWLFREKHETSNSINCQVRKIGLNSDNEQTKIPPCSCMFLAQILPLYCKHGGYQSQTVLLFDQTEIDNAFHYLLKIVFCLCKISKTSLFFFSNCLSSCTRNNDTTLAFTGMVVLR